MRSLTRFIRPTVPFLTLHSGGGRERHLSYSHTLNKSLQPIHKSEPDMSDERKPSTQLYAVADCELSCRVDLMPVCLIPMGLSTPSVGPEVAECQRVLEKSGLEYRVSKTPTFMLLTLCSFSEQLIARKHH